MTLSTYTNLNSVVGTRNENVKKNVLVLWLKEFFQTIQFVSHATARMPELLINKNSSKLYFYFNFFSRDLLQILRNQSFRRKKLKHKKITTMTANVR